MSHAHESPEVTTVSNMEWLPFKRSKELLVRMKKLVEEQDEIHEQMLRQNNKPLAPPPTSPVTASSKESRLIQLYKLRHMSPAIALVDSDDDSETDETETREQDSRRYSPDDGRE